MAIAASTVLTSSCYRRLLQYCTRRVCKRVSRKTTFISAVNLFGTWDCHICPPPATFLLTFLIYLAANLVTQKTQMTKAEFHRDFWQSGWEERSFTGWQIRRNTGIMWASPDPRSSNTFLMQRSEGGENMVCNKGFLSYVRNRTTWKHVSWISCDQVMSPDCLMVQYL